MKVKVAAGTLVFFLAGVFGLMLYDVSGMKPATLILCASNEGDIYIPRRLCEYYMFNHRNIKDDIKILESEAGLDFILNGKDAEYKYKLAEFFISNGMDVNGVNHYGEINVTPLHGAVLSNDVEEARFLVKHGADVNAKTSTLKLTPLELALSLQEKKNRTVDRSEIINYLKTQIN